MAGSGPSPLVKQAKIKTEKKLKKTKLTFSSSPAKSIKSDGSSSASTLAVPIGVGGITVPVFDPAASTLSGVDTSSLSALPTVGSLDATGHGEEQADKPPPPPKEPPVLPESLLPTDVLAKVKDLEEVQHEHCNHYLLECSVLISNGLGCVWVCGCVCVGVCVRVCACVHVCVYVCYMLLCAPLDNQMGPREWEEAIFQDKKWLR